MFSRLSVIPVFIVVAALAGTVALTGCNRGGGAGAAPRISGGGATFVDPIMQKWSTEYRVAKQTEIDYVKSGSGQGISKLTAKEIDFGCSDAPMNQTEADAAVKAGGEVFHIPVTMGAVAVAFNVPGVEKLNLSGKVVADIYMKKITTWNDPAIQDLNKDVAGKLPADKIIPIQRAEASGTTSIFTDYLSKVSPEFKSAVGPTKQMTALKDVTGQSGSDGIAGFVKNNKGAIGYVELSYAKKNGITYAAVVNKAGKAVTPDPDGVTAAAESAMKMKQTEAPFSLHDLTYSLTDADGDKSYPIVGMSYAILYKSLPKEKGPVLVEYLKWVVGDGQKYAVELHYAPLPAELSKRCVDKLATATFQ